MCRGKFLYVQAVQDPDTNFVFTLVYYQNIHLSWNPALFSYRSEKHGFWKKEQGPSDDTFNCGKERGNVVLID